MAKPPPVPESIAKLGIKRVTSNLKRGQSVNFNDAFLRIFRPEIEALLETKKAAIPKKKRRRA